MADNKKVDPIVFDKRVMHRTLSSQEREQLLTKLPDVADQGEDIAPRIFTEKKGNASK
jgi:hypothetical protein